MIRFLMAALAATMMYTLPAQAQQGNVVVIVNASNSTGALTTDEVSRLFLKRQTRWPSGTTVVPVDLAGRSKLKEQFARAFHQRSLDGLDSYWQQQIFSGRETPPGMRDSESEVITFVVETPGGIGYVSSAARLPTGVRVLQVKGS